MPRKDLLVLLEWISREVPSAPRLLARLRRRRRDPVLKVLMQTILIPPDHKRADPAGDRSVVGPIQYA